MTIGRRAHILVIEDYPADGALLRLALDTAGVDYDLSILEDGAVAIEFVRQKAKALTTSVPDLTILDLNLPKNDGLKSSRRCGKMQHSVPCRLLY
jgi:CheY-like chemotaxis protein